jgi:PAS domain S-box-containing protein
MKDEKKTKQQLLAELLEARTRIGELEESEAELVQTREALQKSQERLRTVFESANDEICYTLLDGTVVDVNHKIEDIFGYKPEDVIGRNYAEFPVLGPEDFELSAQIIAEIMEGKPGRVLEFEGYRKDGSRVTIEVNSKLVREGGELKGFLNIIRDITQRKQWEEELKRAKEAAEASDRAKSKFLASMSHEIRTPMNGVIGMSGLLLETELTPEQRECAETIRSSSESLLSIVNDILDFSKIEAGQLDLENLAFDLRTTVEDVTDMLAIRADSRGLEFSCLVHPEVPSLVRGDPGRLRQILTNLISNAIKFTVAGEVFIRVSLEEETDTRILVRFSVTDTGIGIPRDSMHRLFKFFSQLDPSTTRKYGGTGLGLAISKQLAEMMGGQIGVESEEGKGSTFWFTASLEKQPGAGKRERAVPEDIRGARFLVVDDNAIHRQVLGALLRSWGCRFDEAEDGEQALAMLRRAVEEADPYRVVLVDMLMPGMDGERMGLEVKGDPALRDTHMVMLASVGQRGDAARLREAGFAAYLTKPIKKSQLYDGLVTVLGVEPEPAREASGSIITGHSLKEDKKHKVRILVAEDNAVNQKVALRILEKLGYRADAVADGREAVEALETIPYDLVLMDVQMPEMNGFEATRMIRDPQSRVLRHDIPIVAMTAHALKGDRERCLDAGMDDYVTKPVTSFALDEVLQKHLQDPEDAGRPLPEGKTTPLGPIRMERIQEISGGDQAFERELIDAFLAVNEQQFLVLESAIREEDGEEVALRAHMINGSSSNAGAMRMHALALRIEQCGEQGDFRGAFETFVELQSEFARARRTFEDYLKSTESTSSQPILRVS